MSETDNEYWANDIFDFSEDPDEVLDLLKENTDYDTEARVAVRELFEKLI